MTLEQLRIFLAVAQRQHVTNAARDLNLAQSAVSHAIAALERRHDTRLFDRIGRRIELTEAGRALLPAAQAILEDVARIERVLGAFGRLERGTLTVQASQTIAGYWLPRHLVRYRRSHPGIDVRLGIGSTAQVAQAVEAGAVELGFVEGSVESDALIDTAVARDQLIVVVGPDHAWAREPPKLNAAALLAADWVLREPGSGTRSVFEEALIARGIDPKKLRTVMELPSNEAVRAAVESGMGATALSVSVAAPSIETGLLRHVPFRLPERSYTALTRKNRPLGRPAQALLAMLATGPRPALHRKISARATLNSSTSPCPARGKASAGMASCPPAACSTCSITKAPNEPGWSGIGGRDRSGSPIRNTAPPC